MRLDIVAPATLADAAECVGAIPYVSWAVIKLQISAGASMAVRDASGRAVMLAGIFTGDDGVREAWFIAGPEAGKHMLQLVRLLRLTLSFSAYRGIRAVITTGEGRRIARSVGFSPVAAIGGIEIWELTHGQNVRRLERGGG